MSEQKHIWRLLEIGERVELSDEWHQSERNAWLPCAYTELIDKNNVPHRRRVPASPIIRDARTDPPKESDATFGGVVACDNSGWQIVSWDSEWFTNAHISEHRFNYWFALPPIPEPEKSDAEKAYDALEQGCFGSQRELWIAAFNAGKRSVDKSPRV